MNQNYWRAHPGNNFIVVALVLLCGCRSAPIYNAKDVSISPRMSASEEEIAEAIWSAGRRLGWQTEIVSDGNIKAVRHIRDHSATVSIRYSRTSFDIYYVNSENLDYDGQSIHENYNIWISRLAKKIQNEIEFRLPEARGSR